MWVRFPSSALFLGEKMSTGKPHINIGTIGHVDHGKTTLTAAITATLAAEFKVEGNKAFGYSDIDNAPEEKARGITINQRTIKYVTDKVEFSHVDCPGHSDYVKNMITGTSQMDVAILVVAATDGVCPQTKEHVILAKQIGVKNIVVFLNKCDMVDLDYVELAKEEVKDLLKSHGYNLPDDFFFMGSALKALEGDAANRQVILDMIDTVSTKIPLPVREIDKPFLMYIDHKFSITGRGTVATGCIDRGRIKLNEEVELIGGGFENKKVTATGLQAFHRDFTELEAGWNVGILLRGVKMEEIERGMILCATGSIKTYKKMKAEIYLLKKEEGGRHSPITNGYRPQFFIGTGDFTGSIKLDKAEILLPGEYSSITVDFQDLIPLNVGQQFVVREGGMTVCSGKITAVEG